MVAEVSYQRSTLNPNAPIFVPQVYRSVEDFSPEWWDLVKSCSWFRDYWLSLHPNGQDDDDDDDDVLGEEFFDDLAFEDIGSDNFVNCVKIVVKDLLIDVIVPKSPKKPVRSPRSTAGTPKFQMKPVYSVSPKCTPRRINQPR